MARPEGRAVRTHSRSKLYCVPYTGLPGGVYELSRLNLLYPSVCTAPLGIVIWVRLPLLSCAKP